MKLWTCGHEQCFSLWTFLHVPLQWGLPTACQCRSSFLPKTKASKLQMWSWTWPYVFIPCFTMKTTMISLWTQYNLCLSRHLNNNVIEYATSRLGYRLLGNSGCGCSWLEVGKPHRWCNLLLNTASSECRVGSPPYTAVWETPIWTPYRNCQTGKKVFFFVHRKKLFFIDFSQTMQNKLFLFCFIQK